MKASYTLLGVLIVGVLLAFGATVLSLKWFPNVSVKMNTEGYNSCVYYSHTKEIECFKTEYYEQHWQEILNKQETHQVIM